MIYKIFIIVIVFASDILRPQTNSQIEQAKKIIKQTGMTESQVRSAANRRGYSNEQIDAAAAKVKEGNSSDIKKPQDVENNTQVIENSNDVVSIDQNLEVIEVDELDLDSKKQSLTKQAKYFGYDIFKKDPSVFQATSIGAVNPDYIIGPSDEIIVMLWGETQFRQVLTVNREGFIFIPDIGQVFVNGLNLNLLESKLFRVLSKSYASLNPQGGKATTFLDVSLGNLRPLRIQVLGEVSQPGAYTVSPSATLFSSLYYFNGPTTLGSLREIRLIRDNEQITAIDFYDYLLTGRKPKDFKLQIDDIVFIPKRLKTVGINGQVNRPGIYELKEGETLSDLILMSGDLKVTAYLDRVQIDRIVPFEQRDSVGMERIVIDVNLEELLNTSQELKLQDGDNIQIFSILDMRQNTVDIDGAITRPGKYDIGESLRLRELIAIADSLTGEAYSERVDVVRINNDFTEKLITLNLFKVMEGNTAHNILLQGLDRVKIYKKSEMIDQTYVSIVGHVKKSGKYPLLENMTLYDLIFDAGGFVDKEFKKLTYLQRADLIRYDKDLISQHIIHFDLEKVIEDPNSPSNIPLKAGDLIRIYSKKVFNQVRTVSIYGSIANEGSYIYKTNMNLKDLILEAGGVSKDVYRYKVEVARIDPKVLSDKVYAQSFNFEIDNKYSINKVGESIDSRELDFPLKPYDFISLRPDPYFAMQKTITISGSVYYPGTYAILNPNEKISDIIKRAGGLRKNAYAFGSRLIRAGNEVKVNIDEIVNKPKSKSNINIYDGDQIFIAMKQDVIEIAGEVSAPGLYKFTPGIRVNDAIKEAGGFSPNAEREDIFIVFPNGRAKKYNRWFNNPKVLDGSIITVGTKPEEEPFDKTEYAKDLTNIFANLAQAISLIILAKN